MVSEEDLKLDSMWFEAVDRLELMKAHYQDRWMILMNRGLDKKIVVDHKEKSVRRVDVTDEELQMIKKIEAEFGFVIYYLIEDEGVWPDGCTFKRYTLPYVDKYEEEYEREREECIGRCGTCSAYVVNMEDPSCSEITEFKFQNVNGMIINVS